MAVPPETARPLLDLPQTSVVTPAESIGVGPWPVLSGTPAARRS